MSPAAELISAVIKTRDIQHALYKGITNEIMADLGFGPEWDYITHNVDNYGKVPPEASFKNRFPDFDVEDVDNVLAPADEALHRYRHKEYSKLAQRIITDVEHDDVDAARQTVERFVSNGVYSLDSLVPQGSTLEPQLDEAALYGVAGNIIKTIEPYTEADRAGLLLSIMTGFGNAVGPGPHMYAEADKHTPRMFTVLVGKTSRARKGTSWSNIKMVMEHADLEWIAGSQVGGLSSGEGLIDRVQVEDEDDDDEEPQCLFVVEQELGRTLQVMGREGNILSSVTREAWDQEEFRVMNRRSNSLHGRGYISILGHITNEELRTRLTTVDMANGFANRFLWVSVRRSKKLPDGGFLDKVNVSELGKQLRVPLLEARKVRRMHRTPAAEKLWAEFYNGIDDDVPGMFGAITARAEAQVLRLSMIYALLDGESEIDEPHLEAALAVWRYCVDSARYLFGDATGDKVADQLLTVIRAAGPKGLDATEQHRRLPHSISAGKLEAAREDLERRGLIKTQKIETDGPGRPKVVSRAVTARATPREAQGTRETREKSPPATVTNIRKAPTRRRLEKHRRG